MIMNLQSKVSSDKIYIYNYHLEHLKFAGPVSGFADMKLNSIE